MKNIKSNSSFPNRGVKEASNPIKDIKQVANIRDYLKIREYRNYVLFLLGVSTGYRSGDLVGLQVRDIKRALNSGYFVIMESKKENSNNIREKNRKPRKVIIVKKLRKILEDYIQGKEDYEYMFTSRKKNVTPHIGVDRVTDILKEAGEYFKLKKITAHSMRKTYAYRIYDTNGHNILKIKQMLGHSSIEETKDYLGLDRETYDKDSEVLNDFFD